MDTTATAVAALRASFGIIRSGDRPERVVPFTRVRRVKTGDRPAAPARPRKVRASEKFAALFVAQVVAQAGPVSAVKAEAIAFENCDHARAYVRHRLP
jgi:hypothetical protein